MTDLVEECCRVHANERRALNHAPALTDDEWSELWAADELRDGFRVPMRAVIATIGAGLTGEHVEVLERVSIFLDDEDANILNRAAAVVASIVEAKG